MDDSSNLDSPSSGDDSLVESPSANKTHGDLTSTSKQPIPADTEKSADAGKPSDAFSEHRQTVISKDNLDYAEPKKQTSADVGRALLGTQLEHFHLEEFVGGGGMGAVFRATDEKLGRTVAVKVLSRNRKDTDSLRRFTNEAQNAARLDHPNIARVFYVGEDAGWNFIVFEYISGINIRDLVSQQGALSLQDCWSYVLQVADALTHASERDVVHRDIKPSNILVTADGTAKLVDMGLARFHQLDSDKSDATASGVTLGTFDYISPEQARDPRNTDVRGDIYSLGCTLYYMLTGCAPYPSGTVLQKLLSHSGDPIPDPRVYREDLDDGTVQILHTMLAKQPSNRYQTPDELIQEIVSVGERLGLTLSHAGRVWVSDKVLTEFSLTDHIPWIAPLILLAITAIGITQFAPIEPPIIVAEPTFSTAPYVIPEAALDSLSRTDNDFSPAAVSPSVTLEPLNQSETASDPESPSLNADATPITLFVGQPKSSLRPDQLVTETFAEAISIVQNNADIAIVELTGNHDISSLALKLIGRKSRPIMFRSAGDSRSQINVQLSPAQLATNAPRFFHFSSGSISFENVGFRFYLAPEFRQRWSIFQLDDINSLQLTNVDISVIPSATDNRYIQIAVFDFVTETKEALESDATPSQNSHDAANLNLSNCIIRGPVNFLRATSSQQIQARWNNGLFASSDWFLQIPSVVPAVSDPNTSLNNDTKPISLAFELQQLVVSSAPGTIRVYNETVTESSSLPPRLDFNMINSIFVTSPGNPIVVLDQMVANDQTHYRPTIRGTGNCYQNTMLMLIEHDRDDITQSTQLTFNELMNQSTPSPANDWFQQDKTWPTNSISWQATPVPPITTPDYLQTPGHYQLLDYQPGHPGLDYALLPVIE